MKSVTVYAAFAVVLSLVGIAARDGHDAGRNPPESISGHVPRDAGRTMSDATITASIRIDFLKDPDLSTLKIDVDASGGVVTLSGIAENEPARRRAELIARSVKGVLEVHNFVALKRVWA